MWSANDYLTQVNLHNDTLPANIKDAKRVLVVGGGNVAVDAVRCARAPGGGDHYGLPPHHRRGPCPPG